MKGKGRKNRKKEKEKKEKNNYTSLPPRGPGALRPSFDDEAVFFVFKFLHTHTVYSSYITTYVCKGKLCRKNFLWV